MKKTLKTLWVLFVTVGLLFPNFYSSILDTVRLGATNFPTSLDSLTNPGATDSVATVSHSSQHSNANDAIEALEAKLGITSSTAVADSIFAGNGAGSSIWTTFATITDLTLGGDLSVADDFTLTDLGTFGRFLSLASSTIVGGLTITGNSTTTNATSTIGAFTSFATSTAFWGAGLQNCSAGNTLSWASGQFSCTSAGSSSLVGDNASSTNSSYISKSISLTNGDVVLWWGHCSRGGGNSQMTIEHKLVGDGATTTDFAFGGAAESQSASASFTATTTSTGTFAVKDANGCDEGLKITTLFINN